VAANAAPVGENEPGVQTADPTERGQPRPGQVDDLSRRVQRLEQPQDPTLPDFVVADLPDPADMRYALIYVSDEVGGAVPAFSDGTNWRRVTDRAIVS
jgi:hypothetical protein